MGKSRRKCVKEEQQDGNVIIDALEMTGETVGTLKETLEKLGEARHD